MLIQDSLPLIQCTILQVLHRHKNKLQCSNYLVDYNKRIVQVISIDGNSYNMDISEILESTKQEALSKGYNMEIIGGIYA